MRGEEIFSWEDYKLDKYISLLITKKITNTTFLIIDNTIDHLLEIVKFKTRETYKIMYWWMIHFNLYVTPTGRIYVKMINALANFDISMIISNILSLSLSLRLILNKILNPSLNLNLNSNLNLKLNLSLSLSLSLKLSIKIRRKSICGTWYCDNRNVYGCEYILHVFISFP